MRTETQRSGLRIAARALAAIATDHQLVIAHGNGPQVGVLAVQGAASVNVEAYLRDVVGPQTEEMVDYMLEQELGSLFKCERPLATILTMVEVDPDDPAFRNPATLVGPVYLRDEAERLARVKGWTFKPDGDRWRRVVASPEPKRTCELRPIRWLLEHGTIVIAAGGGGIPTMHAKGADHRMLGAECIINKDLAAELLARELDADLFVLLTDVDAVYLDFETPVRRAIRHTSPDSLATVRFPTESMGSKVEAACRFVRATGKQAAIGAPADLMKILQGEAGTTISAAGADEVCAPMGDPIEPAVERNSGNR
jgi:carbamate kinase